MGRDGGAGAAGDHGGAGCAAGRGRGGGAMIRWVSLALVAVLLVVAALAFFRPEMFPGRVSVLDVSYMLLVLLLVAGANASFLMRDGRMAFLGLLIWPALIVALMALYNIFN